jgi:hypothetical protein
MTISPEIVILTSFVFGAVVMYAIFITAFAIKYSRKDKDS